MTGPLRGRDISIGSIIPRVGGSLGFVGLANHRQKHRRRVISELAEIRNRVAHRTDREEIPDEAVVKRLWYDVIDDPDDAFFQYFPAVFMKVENDDRGSDDLREKP